MQALIFADRLGRELEPLTDRTCAALLPVLGKPVLEHTLEALVAGDIPVENAKIGEQAAVQRRVGNDG